jgi:GNAT superfamily N-acetyltransferase
MIEIRRAAEAEFERVGDVCVAAYAPFLASAGHYTATLRDVATRAAGAELLVAGEPGAPVLGTVTFVPHGGPLGEIATAEETEFRMLAVDPAAQGKGIATLLMRHIVEASRALGRERIVCSSQPSMGAAHRVYERLGFTREPSRDWSPVPGVELQAFALSLR